MNNSVDFEDTVFAALANCPPGTVFLAAVSGGADSVAMLTAMPAVLAAFRERGLAFELRCIHVEHGIRPAAESRGDAEFVRSLCKQLHVPCTVVSVKPGKIAEFAKKQGTGIEAAARLFRRRALFRGAARLDAARVGGEQSCRSLILVAHTADDMLETALMRVLRGSGPSGLAAMPVSRGRILRPLLGVSRADVTAYLTEKNISWREDSTNADTQFLRNRVRHCLIPQLNGHFPQWRGAIASVAETQSLIAEFIGDEARRRIDWTSPVSHSSFPISHSLYTNTENFFAQPAIIREEALFQGVDRLLSILRKARLVGGHTHTIKRKNIRCFCEGNVTAVDLGPLEVRKNAQLVVIIPHSSFLTPHLFEFGFSLLIKAPGSYNLKGIALEVSENDGNLDKGAFTAQLPFVLRCKDGAITIESVANVGQQGVSVHIRNGGSDV